jgi:hypothetical protein
MFLVFFLTRIALRGLLNPMPRRLRVEYEGAVGLHAGVRG